MAGNTEFKNMVRKGIVQTVDKETMKARVKFGDKGGIISGDLHILIGPRFIVPGDGAGSGNVTAKEELIFDRGCSVIKESHSHEAYLTDWVPEVGDMVLCLMMPDGDGEGYIIGGIK